MRDIGTTTPARSSKERLAKALSCNCTPVLEVMPITRMFQMDGHHPKTAEIQLPAGEASISAIRIAA